jgi:hypothetical protein
MIQLIYASAATVDFSDEDLKELLTLARKNNESLNVSGMLVYHEGSFLQILEGEEAAVLALYTKIEKDRRHGNVRMLLRSEITTRSFGDWKMGFYDASKIMDSSEAGFVDFFRKGHALENDNGDRARSVLLQFREGSWRQQVDF